LIDLKKIENFKHIAVVAKNAEMLPVCSALYSYLLTMHKKVSFVCAKEDMQTELSFLPWFDKIRDSVPVSAEFVVEQDIKTLEFYDFLKNNKTRLNQKMATALYASLLLEYEGFASDGVNGTVFAVASEIVSCGAECKKCNKFILKRTTLARLRLKSLMLKNMVLKNNAKEAVFYMDDKDLKSTGATMLDAFLIMKEALGLEYVKKVFLVKNDKILKSIEKEVVV